MKMPVRREPETDYENSFQRYWRTSSSTNKRENDVSNQNLRDYGLSDDGTVTGTPTWEKAEIIEEQEPLCPNCGGWLCAVRVPMSHPHLKGGEGVSHYLGCPACPYASPAAIVSNLAR